MNQESGNETFLPSSSSDVDIHVPIKLPKISYSREFLLSLAKVDKTVKLSGEVQLSISCVFQDGTGLLSPPVCVQDSRCQESVPHKVSLKVDVPKNVNQSLHRSNEPYRPPCRYKALPPPTRNSSDLLNGASDSSGSSVSANRERIEQERWRKDTVKVANEASKNTDSKNSPDEFLMSPASRKPTQIQDAVRGGDAGQPSILPKTTENCSSQRQQVQGLITNGTVNRWKKSVNHIDTSCRSLSMMDNGVHLMESKEYSNFDMGHSGGNAHVRESLKKSGSPGFSSWQDVKQIISDSMKQNPSSPGYQIQQELESNSFSSSLDGNSNSSSELCLPDEDSLITFDETFLMLDVDSSALVDSFMPIPERNSLKADLFSPSSPHAMVEKIVESILDDESSIVPHMDDRMFHHGGGLEGSCYSMHARQSFAQICSNQSNAGWDQQAHNSSRRHSVDSTIYSFFSHSYPSNTISQPIPLSHDELRRFDQEVSQSKFQQMINPGKLCLSSFCVSQSGLPLSCTPKLNSMQSYCTYGYQEPSYGGFTRPNPDFHGDSNINQVVVDSLVDMKQRASHWHRYTGGF